MLLDAATFQRFGYHLAEISPKSHKKVLCFCPTCRQTYETQRRYYQDGRLCGSCTSRRSIAQNRDAERARAALDKHNKRSREAGVSARGLPLVGDRAAYWKQYKRAHKEEFRRWNIESLRKRRRSLLGKLANRLRVSLRRRLRGIGLSDLPYTAEELQAHIRARLHARHFRCPMCGASLESGFDIDHIVPLSSAQTADELLELFALANLDVLCPSCNQHRKGSKRITY